MDNFANLNLHVNYIPNSIDSRHLKKIFEEFGEVLHARVIIEHSTRHSKGYGFVLFKKYEDGIKAMNALDGFKILDKYLKVSVSNIQITMHSKPCTPTPPYTPYPPYIPSYTPYKSYLPTFRRI